MKGPDPRQISCHHDRYGNFIGRCSNIVTEAAIQKEKYGLDSIDFVETYDEQQKALGYIVTVKRGDKTGKALDWYLEDATAAAVTNMENGNDLAGERLPRHIRAVDLLLSRPTKEERLEQLKAGLITSLKAGVAADMQRDDSADRAKWGQGDILRVYLVIGIIVLLLWFFRT
jgi:hypothetical protein